MRSDHLSKLIRYALTEPSGDVLKRIVQDLYPVDMWSVDDSLVDGLLRSGYNVNSVIQLLKSVPDDGDFAAQRIAAYYMESERQVDLESEDGKRLLKYVETDKCMWISRDELIIKLKSDNAKLHPVIHNMDTKQDLGH